jgi:MoxR-like ATPase
VTIAGEHRPLPTPFHVLATQNPIEQEGTYPLPEAQLDRFLVQIDVPYPDRETERNILLATTGLEQAEARQVFDPEALIAAQTLSCGRCPWARRWSRRSSIWCAPAAPRMEAPDIVAILGRMGPGAARGAGADADGAGARAAARVALRRRWTTWRRWPARS